MKANELMIGDWVTMEEFHRPHKIVKSDFYGTSGSFEEFNPIPLTEEILKANGFKNNGMDNEFILDGSFRIMQSHLGYFFSLVCEKNVRFYYVHELQHALRLCGLNDLVDNFKIE